jgi:hypothetical protein
MLSTGLRSILELLSFELLLEGIDGAGGGALGAGEGVGTGASLLSGMRSLSDVSGSMRLSAKADGLSSRVAKPEHTNSLSRRACLGQGCFM